MKKSILQKSFLIFTLIFLSQASWSGLGICLIAIGTGEDADYWYEHIWADWVGGECPDDVFLEHSLMEMDLGPYAYDKRYRTIIIQNRGAYVVDDTTLTTTCTHTSGEEYSESVTRGLNMGNPNYGLFTTVDSAWGWTCESEGEVKVVWGERQSFDIANDVYWVKLGGTSQHVSTSSTSGEDYIHKTPQTYALAALFVM